MREKIESLVGEALKSLGVEGARVMLEHPGDTSHGDYSTNAALMNAKALRAKPRDIAEKIAAHVRAAAPAGIESDRGRRAGVRQLPPRQVLLRRRGPPGHRARRALRRKRGRQGAQGHRRVLLAEYREALHRRASALEHHRRGGCGHPRVRRLRGGARQPPRRLGHAVRKDDLRHQDLGRRGGDRRERRAGAQTSRIVRALPRRGGAEPRARRRGAAVVRASRRRATRRRGGSGSGASTGRSSSSTGSTSGSACASTRCSARAFSRTRWAWSSRT